MPSKKTTTYSIHALPLVVGGRALAKNQNLPPREWKSIWLRKRIVLPTVVLTAFFAGSIIALVVLSINHQGLVSVSTNEKRDVFDGTSFTLRTSLAWTFVPVLIFQLYILLVAAIVKAAGARQPYIELNDGATTARSISLDYSAEPAFKAPWKAWKAGHQTLACNFALLLLVSIGLTALAAHLLDTSDVSTSHPVRVTESREFDYFGLQDSFFGIQPVIDIVAATRVYKAQPIPWTTLSHSILPVDLDGVPKTSNFSMEATSYNVGIDCKVLSSPSEFQLEQTQSGWEFKTVDDGCDYYSTGYVASIDAHVIDYLHTYSNISCSAEAGRSRIIIVAALNANYSDSVLTNKTAVSCSTNYYSTAGTLGLSIDPPKQPVVSEFVPRESSLFRKKPNFAFSIESAIVSGETVDSSDTSKTSIFGHVILEYAKSLSEHSYMTGDVLQRATQDLYTTAFAIAANKFLLKDTAPYHIVGQLHHVETRLLVVPFIAYLIIIALAAIEVMLIWIWIHAERTTSILYEEPKGLLGAASILRNSTLIDRVEALGSRCFNGKVATWFEHKDAGDSWVYTSWNSPSHAKLLTVKEAAQVP